MGQKKGKDGALLAKNTLENRNQPNWELTTRIDKQGCFDMITDYSRIYHDYACSPAVHDFNGHKFIAEKAGLNTRENSTQVYFDPDNSNIMSNRFFYYAISVANRRLTGKLPH